MEATYNFLAVLFWVVVIFWLIKHPDARKQLRVALSNTAGSTRPRSPYAYSLKGQLMTPSEREFFVLLSSACDGRYLVFPQIHLSALFRNRTGGRYHKAAFTIINGRSVDYVLCDASTLEPVYAVELDDPTHDGPDRQKRDAEVEAIFADHAFPLVRFRDYRGLTKEQIVDRFVQSRQSVQQDVLSGQPPPSTVE
jgi:hypothetical protein